jgi:hypothetical protein
MSKSAVFPALLSTTEQFKDSFAPRDEAGIPNPESRAPAVLRMKLVGASGRTSVTGLEELPGKSNYFIGNDPKKWRTNVPNYAKVKYANVYSGVDLMYYGNQGKLEYDFVIKPGSDPRQIALEVGAGIVPAQGHPRGAPLRIDGNGDLVVGTDGGEVVFHKPVVYQLATDDGQMTKDQGQRTKDKHFVEGKYALDGSRLIFEVPNYDKTRPLVIDPVLAYSTYLGGSSFEGGSAIAVDASGDAYVTGSTGSSDFPTTSGAFQTILRGSPNVFVTKLSSTGSALVYSTYLGGSGDDEGAGIAVDASGNAYATGRAGSSNFPTTPGAFQTILRGGSNAFVTKLSSTGSALIYSTYVGGSQYDSGTSIAIDVSSNAYVTGIAYSPDFPTTPGAFQTTLSGYYDAFVSKLNATGSALAYSTYLGPPINGARGYGIAVDASSNAYVVGDTYRGFPSTPGAFLNCSVRGGGFVTKLNFIGSTLLYSTCLGGTPSGSGEFPAHSIAIDASGNAYVTGQTSSPNFPTTSGAFHHNCSGPAYGVDVNVTKFNGTGSALVYSTCFGGGFAGSGIAIDGSGNAYVTGYTNTDFPTTPDAFQTTYGGGANDAFVSKLNATGSALVYSSYLGGSGDDTGSGVAVDAAGNFYVMGWTNSSNFPTIPGAFQTTYGGNGDAFVTEISPVAPGLLLTPPTLTFTPQAVGSTSVAQQVRLTDTGTKALDISGIAASGDFAQTNDCPSSVSPAGFCTLKVTFTPTAAGIRTGVVTITDDAPGSPHQLPLTGTGGVPVVTLAPTSLTFASQAVGTTSPAQPATLKNTGSGPLTITSISTAGDFAQTNNCGTTVNAGVSCTFNVTFIPTAAGTRTGNITVTDDATGSPHSVSLTGTGIVSGPAVSFTPSSLPFVAQPVGTFSPAQLATLKNIGGAALKIASIGRSGDFYEGNNCPATLAVGASCTLRVIFTPTSPGTKSSAVTIADNAPGSPHKLLLSGTGTGTGRIVLQLSPNSLSFGSVAVGSTSASQPVTLTNNGTVAASFLEPFGFATSGTNWSDFHKNPHCGTSLAPGKSCTVSVFFKPLGTGTRTGFFLVRQGAASKQIPLSGTGTP